MTGADKVNYDAIELHPRDAVRFFKIMMRLEYAMKATKFVQTKGSGLEVLWDVYVKERLPKSFFEDVKKFGRAHTLIENPPSKQVLNEENLLDFEPSASPITNAFELFVVIRRLRNNLFHGGKSGDPDHERNDELIEQAIIVIDTLLNFDDDLRQAFEGLY